MFPRERDSVTMKSHPIIEVDLRVRFMAKASRTDMEPRTHAKLFRSCLMIQSVLGLWASQGKYPQLSAEYPCSLDNGVVKLLLHI